MELVKQDVLAKLADSQKAKNRLAYELNKHVATINRYIESNDPMLTTATALTAISEELEIKVKDITQEQE